MVGWRGAFALVAALGVVALIALAVFVPQVPGTPGGVGGLARHAVAPRVLAVLALHVLVFAALYAAVPYVVPFMEAVTGISGSLISAFLLVYGGANAVGSPAGGRFADRDAARTLVVATAGISATLLVLYLVGAIPALVAVVALLALGMIAAGMVPSLQYRVVELAGPGGALAQSLPASAANLGVAAGSLAGGVAIDVLSVSAAMVTGAVIGVGAVAVARATCRLAPHAVDEPVPAVSAA